MWIQRKGGTDLDKKQVQIAIGGLLHDIGKVVYRHNDSRRHCESGYDFIKELGIEDDEILSQIRFHHSKEIKNAQIAEDSLAYITYWADNVAAGADRRKKDEDDTSGSIFEKNIPLSSIFNILNGNNQNFSYPMAEIYDSGEANYPQENAAPYSDITYSRIIEHLKDGIRAIEFKNEYVNSLLGVMEANLSFVPSSTDTKQLLDISLYDHVKLTAAIGSCIYEYLKASGVTDYREALYKNAGQAYKQNAFIMLSLDISGIQSFIYKVDSSDALKTLRAKSFYLEILLENIIDELLDAAGVSRANLIYSGGGHAYILLPNTENCKNTIEKFNNELKSWFIDNFETELYLASGYAQCSAESLMDTPAGVYSEIFRTMSKNISENKLNRYTAEEVIALNSTVKKEMTRECRVCGSTDRLVEDNLCSMCKSFINMSNRILDESFISILSSKPEEAGAVLPFDRYMVIESENDLRNRIESDNSFIRAYSKNKMFTGFNVSTRLWIGDYCYGRSFGELAQSAKGIKRLGVLRADVDNLGQAFVKGFEGSNGDRRYVGLSRSATFSRKMSMFFKLHINYILGSGSYCLDGELKYPARNALIVYSGGDDLFIVGPWNEIIEAAVDINDALKKFSQGTLSISAGIGIFPEKFPVKAMAAQTGALEDYSKELEGKNAVTLFDNTGRYNWDEFKDEVIGEKFYTINEYFSNTPEKGNSMMYKMMNYIRHSDEKINLARFAYLLGRIEPARDADEQTKLLYRRFAMKMYKWISDGGRDKEQLLTAIYIYVYLNREREDKNGTN